MESEARKKGGERKKIVNTAGLYQFCNITYVGECIGTEQFIMYINYTKWKFCEGN